MWAQPPSAVRRAKLGALSGDFVFETAGAAFSRAGNRPKKSTAALYPLLIVAELLDHPVLSSVPVQIPPVPVHIAILARQFPALVPSRAVVPIIQIASQFAPVTSDLGIIASNVPPLAPSIVCKHRSRTQSQHQQDSRYRPFHAPILLRVPADSTE
jgi:hypothetical protein